jgi:hypothetical protein
MVFYLKHDIPVDIIYCQLSRAPATATATRKYAVPAVVAYAKDEDVSGAAAMRTERTFQVTQDWQSSIDEASPYLLNYHWLRMIQLFHS